MEADERRWMRDLGALLALPSLWVDHAPAEIADGLLSVLFGVLRLDAAYARFDVPDGGAGVEVWRPSGPVVPAAFAEELKPEQSADARGDDDSDAGITVTGSSTGFTTAAVHTTEVRSGADAVTRVASVALALPWESARVLVAASRAGFPTERETHLLRVAVGQAAIALHTARRLAGEQRARREAERALKQKTAELRALLDDVGPALTVAARRVRQAAREAADAETAEPPTGLAPGPVAGEPGGPVTGGDGEVTATLTPRERDVLALLAQGLSNKEIAGVLWLSDRTVERHITGLYRKIGVTRRSEATAFALRHGVV